MRAALSLVSAKPEWGGSNGSDADNQEKKGNGHPDPSTVLVVEDEVLVRLAVADYLRHRGYRVLEAKTGEEAQAVLRAGEPVEVLFSDVDLGSGMSGVDLAAWTREHFRDIRILLTSGVMRLTESTHRLADRPLLNKPYAYEELARLIQGLLGGLGRRSG
jgi:CheY-like chemotaxis protein